MGITLNIDITKLVDELPSIDFAELLKACMIRLQNEDMEVVRVDLEGHHESSIIFPYVDIPLQETFRFYEPTKKDSQGRIFLHSIEEITHHIK